MAPITQTVQKLSPGAQIVLFDLDMAPIKGGVFRFTPDINGSESVRWKGNIYSPLPIEAKGFEWNGQGALPSPTLSMALPNIVLGAVQSFRDLIGCRVVRWRTFVQYLDGMSEADGGQHFKPEVYFIERKVELNTRKKTIEWELATANDLQGKSIPRRTALRNVCPFTYRTWQGGGFSYLNATCPYNGGLYFDRNGNPVAASQDECGKGFSDCLKRFGQSAPIPYGAFPGVGRVR